ncbi:hypothetical protein TorRG33x02_128990 [Trema orientale]|uniref:Uncharacterized protein n=1 Tax=Trema orientale TaxID=63057 RepID=A0A2P5F0L7_TREOI|nr:hypothetical protein TorRG33x02_128990 [Trema orientale]
METYEQIMETLRRLEARSRETTEWMRKVETELQELKEENQRRDEDRKNFQKSVMQILLDGEGRCERKGDGTIDGTLASSKKVLDQWYIKTSGPMIPTSSHIDQTDDLSKVISIRTVHKLLQMIASMQHILIENVTDARQTLCDYAAIIQRLRNQLLNRDNNVEHNNEADSSPTRTTEIENQGGNGIRNG